MIAVSFSITPALHRVEIRGRLKRNIVVFLCPNFSGGDGKASNILISFYWGFFLIAKSKKR